MPELAGKEVYLFGYFFDRASQADLVSFPNGGPASLTRLQEAARKGGTSVKSHLFPCFPGKATKIAGHKRKGRGVAACSVGSFGASEPHWRPWLCMDLSYIHALLTRGYGLADDQTIFVRPSFLPTRLYFLACFSLTSSRSCTG